MRFRAVFLVALATPFLLPAQDDSGIVPIADLEPLPATTPQANPEYSPLTEGENFHYALNRVFSPGKLALFAIRAAMDQERGVPETWGQGSRAFSERFADHFGRALLRENLAFGVRALDGEDPRYERSLERGVWRRSKHAIGRTFVVRGHNGQLMPAYSLLASDYATPFIAQRWKPEPFSAARALGSGTTGVGIAVASNLAMEFWPDLRHRFLRR